MIKFALVGCGRAGTLHAAAINNAGMLAAVCDVDVAKASWMATRYNANAYNTIDELLGKETGVEVVVIATPNGFHAEHIIKSLQKRKHVLCEGPLCLTTAAAWQIIETEKFCRRKLFLVQRSHYNSTLTRVKEALDNGVFDSVQSFQVGCVRNRNDDGYSGWEGKLFPGGGLLYTPFAHVIDALVFLFGDVVAAKGYRNTAHQQSNVEIESAGAVALQMQTGTFGALNWALTDHETDETLFTIVAEKMTIKFGGKFSNELYTPIKNDVPPDSELQNAIEWNGNTDACDYSKVYENLLTALSANNKSSTDVFDGLKTVAAIETIYKAISQE